MSNRNKRGPMPQRGGSQLGPVGIAIIVLVVVAYLINQRYDLGLFPEAASTATPTRVRATSRVVSPTSTVTAVNTLRPSASIPSGLPATAEAATVVDVTDGDTIKVDVDGQRESVRFVGIDAPESYTTRTGYRECYGQAAKTHMISILTPGMTVFLERDITDTDRYDRLLRYVWVDGGLIGAGPPGVAVLLNAVLVREGFAIPYPYKPDVRDQPEIEAAAQQAQKENVGMWCACGGQRIPESQTNQSCPAA